MKRICAWCGRELEQSERRESSQVTHGVCQFCRRKFFSSVKDKDAESQSRPGEKGDDCRKAGDTCPRNETWEGVSRLSESTAQKEKQSNETPTEG